MMLNLKHNELQATQNVSLKSLLKYDKLTHADYLYFIMSIMIDSILSN